MALARTGSSRIRWMASARRGGAGGGGGEAGSAGPAPPAGAPPLGVAPQGPAADHEEGARRDLLSDARGGPEKGAGIFLGLEAGQEADDGVVGRDPQLGLGHV